MATAVALENDLEPFPEHTVGELGMVRLGSVLVTAAGHAQNLANAPHTVAGGGMDGCVSDDVFVRSRASVQSMAWPKRLLGRISGRCLP